MANRFLETNYYKSAFVRSLEGSLKALYSFIICDCSVAGIWTLDMEAASLYIGFAVTKEQFVKHFVDNKKAIEIGGGKYFFPDFIEHQYPKGLKNSNPAQTKAIKELKKFNLIDDNLNVLIRPFEGSLKTPERYYGNGNGNSSGSGNGNGIPEKSLIGRMSSEFKKQIPGYASDEDLDTKPLLQIANFINNQCNGVGDATKNIEMILKEWAAICLVIKEDNFYNTKPLKTISSQIQEIFQITKNGRTSSNIKNNHSKRFEVEGTGGY